MKRTINNLPSSDNEFWDGEQYSISKPDGYSADDCKHHFVYDNGKISCKYCGFGGFYAGTNPEITLRNGKKYKIHGLRE